MIDINKMHPSEISIERCWNEFERSIIPPSAPPIQRIEMRKAFYGGFMSAFILNADLMEKFKPEDRARIVGRFNAEVMAFFSQGTLENILVKSNGADA